MRFQAVLFDFDGTLVDSEALHYQSWMQVLAPLEISYSEQAFCHEFSGIPTLEAANILKQRHQLPLCVMLKTHILLPWQAQWRRPSCLSLKPLLSKVPSKCPSLW